MQLIAVLAAGALALPHYHQSQRSVAHHAAKESSDIFVNYRMNDLDESDYANDNENYDTVAYEGEDDDNEDFANYREDDDDDEDFANYREDDDDDENYQKEDDEDEDFANYEEDEDDEAFGDVKDNTTKVPVATEQDGSLEGGNRTDGEDVPKRGTVGAPQKKGPAGAGLGEIQKDVINRLATALDTFSKVHKETTTPLVTAHRTLNSKLSVLYVRRIDLLNQLEVSYRSISAELKGYARLPKLPHDMKEIVRSLFRPLLFRIQEFAKVQAQIVALERQLDSKLKKHLDALLQAHKDLTKEFNRSVQ
ncbi:hypothetical protein BC833DRAFT_608188, partial [Globomyces pollinis-pini]